jgi:hypothetical protein
MFKFCFNRIQAILLIVLGIFLFATIVYSSQSDFTNPRKCSDIFVDCGSYTFDDVIITPNRITCNGAKSPQDGTGVWVEEVYINSTNFYPNTEINVTCEFTEVGGRKNYEYIWYYDNSNWYKVYENSSTQGSAPNRNRSVVFNVNSTEGSHVVRCIISYNDTLSTPQINKTIPNECANSSYSNYYDNDDVNFTVTDYFKYDSWNLTNYATGENITDGANLTRNNVINALAYWNKNIFNATIRHNGTSTFQNYTVPTSENLTNYTLTLSNIAEFNATGPIEVSYIWANDTFGLENYTSPSHYFYLWGNSKLSNITINDTVIYNKTAVQVSCKVEDANTNLGIPNYNVSFYRNDTYLNSSLANSTGWANYYYSVNATAFPTNFNITCNITDDPEKYYNKSLENSKNTFLDVVELGIHISVSSPSLVYGSNIEITANVSGNASQITNVNANITFTNFTNGQYVLTSEIRNLTFNQFISSSYQYNLTYTPTIPSNYSVNITVTSEEQRFDTTSFEVWGYSKLSSMILNSTIIYNSTAAQIKCRVLGNYTNTGIPEYNVSFYSNDTYLNNSLTNSTGWANITYIFNVPSPLGNLTILCNMTNSPSLYYSATSENYNSTILGIVDPYGLRTQSLDFQRLTISKTKTNLNDDATTVDAEVCDDIQTEYATLNVSYPPDYTINVSFNMSGSESAGCNHWTSPVSNASYPLSVAGDYIIKITSKNAYGTIDVSSEYTLSVTTELTLDRDPEYTAYMRGENVTIIARNVHNEEQNNLNWTVDITKIGVTETNTTVTGNYTYQIKSNDTEGEYSINVINANQSGNFGSLSDINFTVNSTLNVSALTSRSSPMPPYVNVTVGISVYNARSTLHDSIFNNANISCLNSSWVYTTSNLSFSSGNAIFECYAINEYDRGFNITINVEDIHNNTGGTIINLTTQPSPTTTTTVPPGGGGGGGGGIGGTNKTEVIPSENCTDKIDNDKDNKTDCNDEDCFYHPSCLREIKELNFTLSTDTVEIEQGSDGIVLASLLNSGNTQLNLNSSLEKECCNISTPTGFELRVKEETQFSVNIHVPLYQKEGEYTVKIRLSSGPLTKEKAFKILVKKSPSIIKLEELEKRLTELGSTVTDYQVVGLSVGGLAKTVDESKSDIDTAKTAIANDDLTALQNYISRLEEKVNSLSSTLPSFGVQKLLVDNKWNITGGVLLVIASVYLTTQVFIPYVKLTAEMTKLRFEELAQSASRKKTETQYFLRKIDEQTFRRIVSEKHGQVLKLQSTITLKKQQRSELFRRKLNPLSLAEYIKNKTAKKSQKNVQQVNQ